MGSVRRFIIKLSWIVLLVRPLYAQVSITDVQALAGPWECVDADGIHGIFLSASGNLKSPGAEPKVPSRIVSIYVSRRLKVAGGQGGYFYPDHDGRDVDGQFRCKTPDHAFHE